jgi:hypothetical protein
MSSVGWYETHDCALLGNRAKGGGRIYSRGKKEKSGEALL